jgi:hypothetical protein
MTNVLWREPTYTTAVELVEQATWVNEPVEDNLLVRAHALMLDRKPKVDDELIEKIRAHAGVPVEAKDVYPFRMVAASDGVDSYWTQHDLDASLKPMAEDLQRGQSLLGNHVYETFAYGSSVDGRVVRADEESPIYEASFAREVPENLRTKHWLVGDYYVVRGLKLNGEETDSIIRAMELGAVRKASISFMVDEYRCGIDGKDMLLARMMSGAGKRHEVEETECMHIPGVDYGDDGLAWAIMHGAQLIETSLVYKNSSPSSLLLRKAEELARAGLLSIAQVAQAESRFGVRLPSFERKVWTPGKEDNVPKRDTDETVEVGIETAPPEPGEAAPAAEAEPVVSDDAELEQEEEETAEEQEPTADAVIAEFVAAGTAIRSAITAELLSSDQLAAAARVEQELDAALAGAGATTASALASRATDAAWQTRTREADEALGRPVTAEAIRSLKAEADLGRQLFDALVNDTVAARNGLGAEYSVESYRELLRNSRSVEFVKAERASYEALKTERFKAGRQVVPPEVRPEKAKRTAPAAPADDDNILARKKEV